jgi:purine-binding chemotaxis protein CheW
VQDLRFAVAAGDGCGVMTHGKARKSRIYLQDGGPGDAMRDRPVAQHDGEVRVVLARVGARICALPLAQVIETMRLAAIHALAEAPPFVRGLAIIRGAPLPVIDVRLLLGEPGDGAARLVVVRAEGHADGRRLALAVDAVIGVRALDGAALAATPPLAQAGRPELVEAIGAVDAQLLLLLRTSRIVDEALWARLEQAAAGEGG